VAKLQLNDDGTVMIPLIDGPNGEVRVVLLREPSLGQIGRMRRLAKEADDALGRFDTIDVQTATPEQVDAFNQQLNARTDRIFDGDASPHGQALIAIIKELSGEAVVADDLPAWAGSPRTLGAILGHFQAPLPGPESEPTTTPPG